MGERLRRQENMRVLARLSLENIRRAFFTALISCALLPVMLVINVFSFDDNPVASVITALLIVFEILTIAFTVFSFMAMKSRDDVMCLWAYRGFWILFELFSFVLIYANKLAGGGITFYCVMLIVLMLVPALETLETLYGLAAEAVYMVFLFAKFGTNGFEVLNIILMNALLYAMSRYLFKQTKEHIRLKERVKDSDGKVEIDRMTGLLNRKGLERMAYMSIMSSIKAKKRFTVLMIDIDELQLYNTEHGAKRGDDLIKIIGGIIRNAVVKNTDIVARLDGGKFLVCMEGGRGKDDEKLAEKVKELVDRKRIPHSRGSKNRFVTVSIGVATAVPSVDNDYYDLYDAAEKAMFAAKDSGRNAIEVDNLAYAAL
ncbi:MAG: GGDEF domain-containing protein [Lachnospiraceae bacterium]|nr:GGDEF domain-containing protein [Lachnospiraceae bacterium]